MLDIFARPSDAIFHRVCDRNPKSIIEEKYNRVKGEVEWRKKKEGRDERKILRN